MMFGLTTTALAQALVHRQALITRISGHLVTQGHEPCCARPTHWALVAFLATGLAFGRWPPLSAGSSGIYAAPSADTRGHPRDQDRPAVRPHRLGGSVPAHTGPLDTGPARGNRVRETAARAQRSQARAVATMLACAISAA